MEFIPFNRPYLTGKETDYIHEAVKSGHIAGNGIFTKKCHEFLEQKYGFRKCLLTTSCTDAIEMAAMLIDVKAGDEIIMPSYTFVSTANPFVLRGAKIVFVDSQPDNPNLDMSKIEEVITPSTKAVVPMHYAGVACDMDPLISLSKKYNFSIIEDAAQAINSYYRETILGSIGDFGTFSFHETKNVIAGEGGMISINTDDLIARAEIIREKGTNRSAFFRGEVNKYEWVDIGSSFLPSELIAAFLYAQLEHLEELQNKRLAIWHRYHDGLVELSKSGKIGVPDIPDYATNNAHMYYILCESLENRSALIEYLRKKEIYAVFHYQSLHKSPFYIGKHDGRELGNAEKYSDCLVRLPFYYELENQQIDRIIESIHAFYS